MFRNKDILRSCTDIGYGYYQYSKIKRSIDTISTFDARKMISFSGSIKANNNKTASGPCGVDFFFFVRVLLLFRSSPATAEEPLPPSPHEPIIWMAQGILSGDTQV